ncbi:MAG: DegT/DnrJ/EryC1/StrS family aminotransferase [bacterium]
MNVPLLDLKAQYVKIKDEVRASIDEVCESQYFILGPKVQHLEERIAEYSEAKYGVGVSSGTDALLISLMAIDIMPGDEVITTPFTFFATGGVISRLGAKPVFVDIDPITFNIDASLIEQAITLKTKAIMPVHLFGQVADMDSIMAVAAKHKLFVIEDAAQSIGSEYKGKRAGSIGHLGCFSFFPSKNLGGFGDGGMVVTNDPDLHQKLKILRVHGSKPKYYHKFIGGNFRLDALQAAILDVKLNYLDDWSAGRRRNADYYDEAFKASGLIEKGFVTTPNPVYKNTGDKNYHIYNQFTLRAKDRDSLRSHMKEFGIGAEIYYPVPLHVQECYADLGYKAGDMPQSEKAAAEVISIPIYPELTTEQKEYVVETIIAFY